MKIAIDHHEPETKPAKSRRRQFRVPVIVAGAATIATLSLLNMVQPADQTTDLLAGAPANVGFAIDDPTDPGGVPQPDPNDFPTNPGWSSQSDPGWNADPGWDFQPAPEN